MQGHVAATPTRLLHASKAAKERRKENTAESDT